MLILPFAYHVEQLNASQKGFAPVIHGIARGTAQVSIKQNGYEIYHSTVPPGPFTISDLYAAGNGGDLQVTVKETDGSSQNFTVPYSSVPVLQRGLCRIKKLSDNILFFAMLPDYAADPTSLQTPALSC